jgi:hypothetical protein
MIRWRWGGRRERREEKKRKTLAEQVITPAFSTSTHNNTTHLNLNLDQLALLQTLSQLVCFVYSHVFNING